MSLLNTSNAIQKINLKRINNNINNTNLNNSKSSLNTSNLSDNSFNTDKYDDINVNTNLRNNNYNKSNNISPTSQYSNNKSISKQILESSNISLSDKNILKNKEPIKLKSPLSPNRIRSISIDDTHIISPYHSNISNENFDNNVDIKFIKNEYEKELKNQDLYYKNRISVITNNFSRQIDDLGKEILDLQRDRELSNNTIDELENMIKIKNNEITQNELRSREKYDNLNKTLNVMEENNRKTNNSLTNALQRKENEISQLKANYIVHVKTLENSLNSITVERDDQNEIIAQLKSDNNKYNIELNQLKREERDHIDTINDYRQKLDKLKEHVANNDSIKEASFVDLSQNFQNLQNDYNTLEIENQQLNNQLKIEREVCNSYQSNIKELNEHIKSLDQKILKLKTQYQDSLENIKNDYTKNQNILKENYDNEIENLRKELEENYNNKRINLIKDIKEKYDNEYKDKMRIYKEECDKKNQRKMDMQLKSQEVALSTKYNEKINELNEQIANINSDYNIESTNHEGIINDMNNEIKQIKLSYENQIKTLKISLKNDYETQLNDKIHELERNHSEQIQKIYETNQQSIYDVRIECNKQIEHYQNEIENLKMKNDSEKQTLISQQNTELETFKNCILNLIK